MKYQTLESPSSLIIHGVGDDGKLGMTMCYATVV